MARAHPGQPGRDNRGLARGAYLDYESGDWRPYRFPAPAPARACCINRCKSLIKPGQPVALVFAVDRLAHWSCFMLYRSGHAQAEPAPDPTEPLRFSC